MGNPEQDAFVNIKAALCSDSVLRHYDSNADLVLRRDISSIEVGAALLQPSADNITTCGLRIQNTKQRRTKLLPNRM